MKFRKKPVVIDAVQWKYGDSIDGVCEGSRSCETFAYPHIHTLEGQMRVSDGDWIITGVKGEKYPCKPAIFEMTYELLDSERP